jgi:SulP family sulfate permease
MGGIPATGAIARTATNIRSGARTPVAGIVHAVAILAMMAIFAPWASYIPLAALAAVLAIVCWKMAELHVFTLILQGSVGDRAVLILTFLLTVFVDLSFAIGAGVVLAALFFARDMAGLAHARTAPEPAFDHEGAFAAAGRHASGRNVLPPGLEVFHLSGPLFFATAAQFEEVLSRSGGYPKVLILRMGDVPLVDATGASALRRAVDAINARGTRVVLCEISPSASALLRSLSPDLHVAATLEGALEMGRAFLKH